MSTFQYFVYVLYVVFCVQGLLTCLMGCKQNVRTGVFITDWVGSFALNWKIIINRIPFICHHNLECSLIFSVYYASGLVIERHDAAFGV